LGSIRKQEDEHMIDAETRKAFVAAGHHDLETVKTMLTANPELLEVAFEWQPGDFETALQAASHVGNSDIALYLLEHGAKPQITTAAMLGDTASVHNFLQTDPSLIHAKGAHGISLLVHAVISSNRDLVRNLISKGATDGASMALNIATDIGEIPVIQVLLEGIQPDVNWKNMRGKSALEIASENGQTEILALLER
jgi:uncharacterized protein